MSEIPSLILLHGTDEYAIASHINKLATALGDSPNAAMNIAYFDGRAGFDFEVLNSALNAAPFISPQRLVVINHPSSAFSSTEGNRKFLELLSKIPSTTTVVLVEHEMLKTEHWLLKWLKRTEQKSEIKIYSLPKRWEMPHWIEGEVKKQGGQIESAGAARLAEMVGENTRITAQEVTKLLTYVNFKRPITLADVEQVSIVSAQENVFEMVDALGMGDSQKAQKVLHRLLENEEPFELWGMVIRQFRLLMQAREILDQRGNRHEVQKELGLHEFVAGKITEQARRFSIFTLEDIYHKLLEIDEGVKMSQIPLELALDTFVVEISQKP